MARVVLRALLAASLLALAAGDIVQDELVLDDRSIVLIARPFGFQPNGVLSLELDGPFVHLAEGTSTYDKSKLGFFITTAEAAVQLQQDLVKTGARAGGLQWAAGGPISRPAAAAAPPASAAHAPAPAQTPPACWTARRRATGSTSSSTL